MEYYEYETTISQRELIKYWYKNAKKNGYNPPKPKNCSDLRWRIFKRFIKRKSYYENYGCNCY